MSTVSDRPAEQPAAIDPFRYGWRYVRVTAPDGTESFDQVPLTLEDVLHPEVGDFIVRGNPRGDDLIDLKGVFKARLCGDPTAVVLSKCRVDFNIPGVALEEETRARADAERARADAERLAAVEYRARAEAEQRAAAEARSLEEARATIRALQAQLERSKPPE